MYTGEGYKEIQDIKAGDEVYSENPETGEKGLKKVAKVFVKEVHQIVHIVADGEEIDTTAPHPFWVEGKGWTEAGDIKAGDKLKMYSGEILEVKSAYVEYLENPVKVYNFEVEDWHTYFVSKSNVFVHNGCGGKGLTGNNWGFNPGKDVDLRGSGKTYRDGLDEAFNRTGLSREQFEVTKWGKDINGKSVPVEWEGPHQPHIGYQTPGKGPNRIRGHIFVDNVPATRR